MTEDRSPIAKIRTLRRYLQQTREQILDLAPEKALERILDHPDSAALVHSFPAQDLHLLLHEIGPEDGLPVLALASDQQLEYILDQEVWQHDRIDLSAASLWFDRLIAAAPGRAAAWLARSKIDLLHFFLFNSLEIRVREHDQDPSDFGEGFFSLDDTLYFRIRPLPTTPGDDGPHAQRHAEMLRALLAQLADIDYHRFHQLMLHSTGILPAEIEEEEYRLRCVRLAEKGFLPFEEAVGLYQPIGPGELRDRLTPRGSEDNAGIGVSAQAVAPVRLVTGEGAFGRALRGIADHQWLLDLQSEFAALSNRLIVADRQVVHNRDDLKTAVRKAVGYLDIALERLEASSGAVSPKSPAKHGFTRLLRKYPLESLFRLGYGEAVRLKRSAETWLAGSWFASRQLGLAFWGEEWFGLLGGLLLKRPRFFDNYRSGVLYREFEQLSDIQATEARLNQIQGCDRLLTALDLPLAPPGNRGFLTYKNLLLTAWARDWLGEAERPVAPLTLPQLRTIVTRLFVDQAADPDAGRCLREESPGRLRDWLARRSGLERASIDRMAGTALDDLLREVQGEYGRVAPADLDPRYIQLFLVEPSGTGTDA